MVLWGLDLFGYVDIYPWVSLLVIGLVLWGLATVAASLYPKRVDPRLEGALAWTTVGVVVGAFVVWGVLQVITAPGYGTDEIAFDQYAAQLVLHGMNPYVHSMAPAFSLFHVSPDGYTFLLNGQPVTSLSYPALSFLFYVPFLALGWTTQMRGRAERRGLGTRHHRRLRSPAQAVSPAGAPRGQPGRVHQLRRGRRYRRPLRPPAHRRGLPLGWVRRPAGPRHGGVRSCWVWPWR